MLHLGALAQRALRERRPHAWAQRSAGAGRDSTPRLEFSLTGLAALLTIVGYSINDTVVIYDRIREDVRRFKTMPLPDLIDRSINETLARTVMTSATTLLALFALVVFDGPIIRDVTIAMIWGILIGTYSTVYVAAPMILHLRLPREAAALEVPEPGT